LAVGYENAATVDLFDGHSLAPLPRPNVKRLRHRNFLNVTWSKDGKTLYAGGAGHTVLAWTNAERRALPAGNLRSAYPRFFWNKVKPYRTRV
jgi:hypothetical protein